MSSAACVVDGCNSDLNSCREYYKRHKVCEGHAKSPVVMVQGKEKRFCQQCSKFHSLDQFDDEKRSCRTRLVGHNRRRRKLQQRCFCFSTWPGYDSNLQVPRFFEFSRTNESASMVTRKLPATVEGKAGGTSQCYNRQWLTNDPFKGSKQQSIFQEHQPKISKRAGFEVCFSQRVHDTPNTLLGSSHESTVSSNSALYLLSTCPKQTSVTGFTHNTEESNSVQQVLHTDKESPINADEEHLLSSPSLIDELMDSVMAFNSKETNIRVS